ncbi:MAG TPA: cytochrome c biogenesis protein CcsA [Anaerolineae bacterium]
MELNIPQSVSVTNRNASSQTTRAIGIATAAMFIVALVLVFLVAPRAQDEAGGNVQRIFYFHISSAWNGFGAWIVTAVAGAYYLKRRDLKYDRIAVSAAEIGVLFITMVLLSGMLWARPTWNTWWTWDFKLTLSALQFLMYIAYLMLRSGLDDPNRRARFAAVYGIVGVLTVPLNFLVSRVLSSIHPAVFGPSVNATQQGGFGITPQMALVLVFCMITFTLLFIFILRVRISIQERGDVLAASRAELSY